MDDTLLCRAFDVGNLPEDFDPSIPPSTGEEYLQHVMYEASNCPQVVVADRTKFKKATNPTLNFESKTWEGSQLAPSLEWQQVQVAKFSDLRQRINRLRKNKNFQPVQLPVEGNKEWWYELFFGRQEVRLSPHLTVLLSMNETLLIRIFEYHAEWIEGGLKPDQGRWIYSLLACLDFPLSPDLCSSLRDIARACARIRSKKVAEDEEVVALNLIICLVSKYFGQTDLGD